jgi:outer membrane protein OmpA-like peptidoglycan-associated protein
MIKLLSVNRIIFCTLILLTLNHQPGYSQLNIDTTISIETLIDKILVGKGIRVGNIKCHSDKNATGYYKCKANKIGISSGLLVSTGYAIGAIGPNNSPGLTGLLSGFSNSKKADKDLKKLSKGIQTYDITTIEFDFVPLDNKVKFDYSFGSEEYKEYVGSRFNDVFGFFISGPDMKKKNVALLPNDKKYVAINNINHKTNKNLFIDNDPFINKTLFKNIKYKPKITFWQKVASFIFGKRNSKGDTIIYYTNKLKKAFLDENMLRTFQYDGFTKKLSVEFYATPYLKYHIKISIGDVGDAAFDSGVFIEEKSFTSTKDTTQLNFVDYVDKSAYFNFDSIFGIEKDKIVPIDTEDSNEVFEKTTVYFDVNSYEIPDSCKKKLDDLANMLVKNPDFNLTITGFTDNTGNYKDNQTLSEKRAISVTYYLAGKGVGRNRLKYIGLSSEEPVGDNNTIEGKALNRRVEIDLNDE